VQPDVPKGGYHFPTQVTHYVGVDPDEGPRALVPSDTESTFGLIVSATTDPTMPGYQIYTLPGLPFDLTIPPDRLLKATAITGNGAFAAIGPIDFLWSPSPTLADFRAIVFYSIGDYARVRWTGLLWSVYETGGPSAEIVVPGQTFPGQILQGSS
jgi:hypothetical protein